MNIRSLFFAVILVGGSSAFLALGASAQADDSHPGFAVYQEGCASCHGGGDARAPRLGILRAMSADDLRYALTEGLMAQQGSALSAQDRATVVEYLAAPEVAHEITSSLTGKMTVFLILSSINTSPNKKKSTGAITIRSSIGVISS